MDSNGNLTEVMNLRVITQFSQLAAFTIMYYDYFLTLSDEVRLFWDSNGRKRMGGVFLVNRYVQLFGNTFIIMQDFGNASKEGCHILLIYHQCFVLITQTIVGSVLIMRTFAVFEKQLKILLPLAALVTVLFGLAIWAIFAPSTPSEPVLNLSLVGCPMSLSTDELRVISRRLAIVWEGVLFADTAVLGLTAYKVYLLRKSAARDLLNVILRDGFIYYLMIVIANSLNIVTFLSSEVPLRGTLTTFANVVSATSVSRLMLNLRIRAHSTGLLAPNSSFKEEDALTADIIITPLEDDEQHASHHDLERHSSEGHEASASAAEFRQ